MARRRWIESRSRTQAEGWQPNVCWCCLALFVVVLATVLLLVYYPPQLLILFLKTHESQPPTAQSHLPESPPINAKTVFRRRANWKEKRAQKEGTVDAEHGTSEPKSTSTGKLRQFLVKEERDAGKPLCQRFSGSGKWTGDSWEFDDCHLVKYTPELAKMCLKGRSLHFIGNSVTYHNALSLRRFLDGESPTKGMMSYLDQWACYNYASSAFDMSMMADEGALAQCQVLDKDSRNGMAARFEQYNAAGKLVDSSGDGMLKFPVEDELVDILSAPDQEIPITYISVSECAQLEMLDSSGTKIQNPHVRKIFRPLNEDGAVVIMNCGIYNILNDRNPVMRSSDTELIMSILSGVFETGPNGTHPPQVLELMNKEEKLFYGALFSRQAGFAHRSCVEVDDMMERLMHGFSKDRVIFMGTSPFAFGRASKNNGMALADDIQTLNQCQEDTARRLYYEYIDMRNYAVERLDTYDDHVHHSGPVTKLSLEIILNSICNVV